MDLLRRYLHAVEFWLPAKQKQDILAELSDDIRSEIEEREEELGRPVGQAEFEAILTRWGHPMLAAGRYLPQRSLIGPVLLPAYKLVMTIVALVYLLPWLLVAAGFVIFDPGHRTPTAIREGLQSFWLIALHLVVIVTGTFAVLERHQANPDRGRHGTRASSSNARLRAIRTRYRVRSRLRSWSWVSSRSGGGSNSWDVLRSIISPTRSG